VEGYRIVRCSVSIVVDALGYKSKGRVLVDPNFSIYLSLPATLGPGVYSASNRNEYQKQKKKVSEELSADCA
jgi:hypothetical protein